MARNRIGLQFTGWEELIEKIDKVAGDEGMKHAVEDGLKASKQHVNAKIKPVMTKSNLPAHGDYSHGGTLDSLDKNFSVDWNGPTAEIKVGFDFSKSGLKSIFLMHGTPRHKPPMAAVPGLYEAIYGKKTVSEIKRIQKEAITKYIERGLK